MKLINWIKNNYLIVVLFLIVVFILMVKINISIKENKINEIPVISTTENKPKNDSVKLVSIEPTIKTEKTLFGGKTKEEISQIEAEERYDFINKLNREEIEELDMMPNYDFSDSLPFSTNSFIVEKFDYENKKITIKPLINDKTRVKEEVDSWLFYSTGNNPRKIEIIWNE